MIFRALDSDGDWTFGKGIANYWRDSAAIAGDVKTSLLCFLADCFFDETTGIDWLNLLGTNNEGALLFSVNSTIVNRPGISNVTQLSVSRDEKRHLSMAYAATTVFGTVVNQDSFNAPVSPFTGISKFTRDLVFAGETFQDVDVSSTISDAQNAVWFLYDTLNGFTPVIGAVSPLTATTVRVEMLPPVTGTFRLVGIA